ncbi:MAG: late competence development ComFB family protein [Treponemataceae bacterium]
MPFARSYDFDILINEAERLVLAELERQLDTRSGETICLCEDCVLDMAAYTLNAVKPRYRVSLLGSMYAAHAMDEESYAKAVRTAVTQAIDKVSKNPSHD